jgi:hypothetical protein
MVIQAFYAGLEHPVLLILRSNPRMQTTALLAIGFAEYYSTVNQTSVYPVLLVAGNRAAHWPHHVQHHCTVRVCFLSGSQVAYHVAAGTHCPISRSGAI